MNEINSFLESIKSIINMDDIKEGSNLEKNIYLMLRHYNVSEINEKNKDKIFLEGERARQCADALDRRIAINRKGIFEYIAFNRDINDRYDYSKTTKLYIPLDYNNICSSIDQIYKYIISEGIKCETKVSTNDISDNFVVRLYNVDDVYPFIEYLEYNSLIKMSSKKCNPFVPCKDGIGIVQDSGIKQSYNGTVSHLLKHYLVMAKKNNFMNSICLEDFMNYIIEYINSLEDEISKFDCLCVLRGLIQIKDGLDPLADIMDNINNMKYC